MDDPGLVCQEVAAPRTLADINRAKTCCPIGHPYSGENLRISSKGDRVCRTCIRVRQRECRNRRKQLGLSRPSARERTHCPYGHPYAGANIFVTAEGHRKCRQCERARWRKRDNPKLKKSKGISRHTAFLVDEAINAGYTISEIIGRAKNTKRARIVAGGPLRRFRLNNPKISQRWETKLRKNRSLKPRETSVDPALVNDGAAAKDAVMTATRNIPGDIRNVVATDMLIAIYDGSLLLRDVDKRMKEFERAYYRQEKHSVQSKHGNWSLDKPMFEDGSGTWADAYSDDDAMWGENSKAIYSR